MRSFLRRPVPFILSGVFLFNLADAGLHGGRANWLMVAATALALALSLWWSTRTTDTGRPPT